MLNSYYPVVLAFIVAIIMPIVMVALNYYLGPKRPSPIKSEPFECGSDPIGEARTRFSSKFYLVAIIFIIFDIEAVFLYPWAVQFKSLGWFGLVEMFIFLGILSLGLLYIWRRGALEWDK